MNNIPIKDLSRQFRLRWTRRTLMFDTQHKIVSEYDLHVISRLLICVDPTLSNTKAEQTQEIYGFHNCVGQYDCNPFSTRKPQDSRINT